MSFAGGFSLGGGPQAGRGGSNTFEVPKTLVQLTVAASGLADKDVFSKSDPLCILYVQDSTKQYTEVGRTETLTNTLDPQWLKKFDLEYRFEEKQNLKFVIIDQDSASSSVQDHDSLGFLEVSLGEVVAGQSKGFFRPLKSSKGSIRVYSVELKGSNKMYTLSFSARGLDNKDFFGKSDPFLQINKLVNGIQCGPLIHRTEYINNDLNPQWKQFSIKSHSFNNDDKTPLVFCVYDQDADGSHDLIGRVNMSMDELVNTDKKSFPIINEKKQAKKGKKYTDSGMLILNSVHIEEYYTFLDYVQNGLQMQCTISIDFTGSNGNPQDSTSLHYIRRGHDNQYTLALRSVGEIIQDYDYDKQFPCLGFGARVPPHGEVKHDFFVNLDPGNPYCAGIPGVLAAYEQCIRAVTLYGPTNFSPVIEHVARFASEYQYDQNSYFVLLIITDGIITDMDDTVRSIVAASTLPMSIIIVGVGDEDFSAMERLDSDNRKLTDGIKTAERDIVQFVELRRFAAKGTWNKEALAANVLAELPDQVTSYMKKMGYKPNYK